MSTISLPSSCTSECLRALCPSSYGKYACPGERRANNDRAGGCTMRSTGMSPVVEAWSTSRTSSARDWPPDRLLQAKGQTTVSVVMPARDEEATVGMIATAIRSAWIQAVPLVDEIIVVDSRSVDGTAAAARAAGAFVVSQDDITRGLPPMHGKGDAMWAGLAVASGDIVAFVDADLREFDPRFVTGLLGPAADRPVGRVRQGLLPPATVRGLGPNRTAAAGSPNWSPGRCSTSSGPIWPASCSRSPVSTPAGGRCSSPGAVRVGLRRGDRHAGRPARPGRPRRARPGGSR
jgi:hypothetical protein